MAAGGEQVFLVWFGVWFGDFLGCVHRLETAKAGDTEAGRISRESPKQFHREFGCVYPFLSS